MRWDIFISHATEDKKAVAEPLAQALKHAGLKVWYDQFELKLGDRLRRSIDNGLCESRFGIVILSPSFFKKHWPQQELDGLAQREEDGQKVILPIWYSVTAEEVREYSPVLADRIAAKWEDGLEAVVAGILSVMKLDRVQAPPSSSTVESRATVASERHKTGKKVHEIAFWFLQRARFSGG